MQELVSIALCTYNPGHFLQPLLDSLVNQSWKPLEIVCCDDNSSDNTLSVLKNYERAHPGLFSIHVNETNLGYIKNFEKCLSLCSGNYIAIADHDDIWEPSKIAVLYAAIGDALMVYSDSLLIDANGNSNGKKISDIFRLHDNPPATALAFYDFIWGHTTLLKKDLLALALPVPEKMPYDTWLAYTAAAITGIHYVDKPLTKWRQHAGSFTSQMYEKNQEKRKQHNWRFEDYLDKKQRLYVLMQNEYGDKAFMETLYRYYAETEKRFSRNLFFFLAKNRKRIFPIWRRNYISSLNEFRKMSRRIKK